MESTALSGWDHPHASAPTPALGPLHSPPAPARHLEAGPLFPVLSSLGLPLPVTTLYMLAPVPRVSANSVGLQQGLARH